MRRYFTTAMAAHLRAGGSLYLLTILGVALGVAAVLSIQIINRNAIAAFAGSVKAVSGEADLSVLGYYAELPRRPLPARPLHARRTGGLAIVARRRGLIRPR